MQKFLKRIAIRTSGTEHCREVLREKGSEDGIPFARLEVGHFMTEDAFGMPSRQYLGLLSLRVGRVVLLVQHACSEGERSSEHDLQCFKKRKTLFGFCLVFGSCGREHVCQADVEKEGRGN